MGSFCASFGKSQKTETSQQQEQSGQTTSNFLPQLQQAFGTLQSQYANIGNMGANPYQTGAADAQMGVAGNLQPAYGAAGNVATSGIGDVSRYMSPYISNVVDATRADFAAQNARDLSNVNAQAARTGALTGTGAAAARNQAMESQRRTQDATIANLYNQGFQQSGQLAQADASARLAGANSIGSLTGVNSNANATLGSLGQGIFQSNLAPYTLANQYASGVAGLAGAGGSSYTGTSSGTSNSNQQQIPGAGSVAMGLLGTGMMLLKDGGRVDETPSITERYHQTLADLHRASKSFGGGMEGMPGMGMMGGGKDKEEPFSPVNVQWQEMKIPEIHKSYGGGADGYSSIGGFVHPSQNDPAIGASWEAGTTVTPEKADMSKYNAAGADLMRQSGLDSKQGGSGFAPVNVQWMPMMRPQMADGGPVRRFADGGFAEPGDDMERTTTLRERPTVGIPYEAPTETFNAPRMDLGGPQPQSPSRPGDYLRQWLPGLNEGVWVGKAPTSTQRFGAALTQIGWDNPFAGVGKSTFDQFNSEDQRRMQRDMAAKQLAQQAQIALGRINGQQTVQDRTLQEQIRQHNAEIALKEKQLRIDGIKPNPVTGQFYSSDPQSPFYPRVGTGEGADELELIARKETAKKAPENIVKTGESFDAADAMVGKLEDLEALMPHMVSGSFAGAELEGRKMLARLGFGDPNKVASTEIARSLTQQLVLDATKNLRPATDLDVKFAQKATATIESDPSTLSVLIPGLKAAAMRSRLRSEMEMASWRRGRAPIKEEIEKQLDSVIPSPYKTYARQLELGRVDGPASGPRVTKSVTDRLGQPSQPQAPRSPPDQAVSELLANAGNPAYIASFNKHFNGGRPGLAESIIQSRPADSIPLGVP